MIDQTNPTPRLRKAQALTALGAERRGDTLLAEIAHRAWHERWSGVAEQARAARARQARALAMVAMEPKIEHQFTM